MRTGDAYKVVRTGSSKTMYGDAWRGDIICSYDGKVVERGLPWEDAVKTAEELNETFQIKKFFGVSLDEPGSVE